MTILATVALLCLVALLAYRQRVRERIRYPELVAVDHERARHSPDRRWWYDGRSWQPAISDDGRRWFDGRRWRPNRRRLAGRALHTGFALLVSWPLAAGVGFAYLISAPAYPGQRKPAWAALVGPGVLCWLVAAAVLVVLGAILSASRPLRRLSPEDRPPQDDTPHPR